MRNFETPFDTPIDADDADQPLRHRHPGFRRGHRPEGGPGFGPGFGPGGFGPDPRGRRGRGRSRVPRGDVRLAVLQLLTEEPMHGYQLMEAISERSGGRWKPSPGTIYPTISQLEDEGLVEVTVESGRKLVTLTEAGREEAEQAIAARPDPFAGYAGARSGPDLGGLVGEIASAVRQVARSGDEAQIAAAATQLSAVRRSLYLLLADGAPGTTPEQPTEE